MLEQKEVQIGSEKMVIESLPATKALNLLARLMRIAGGAGKGVSDLPNTVGDIEKDLHVGAMIQGVLEQVDPSDTPVLIKGIVQESLPVWRDKPGFSEWYENRFSRRFDDLLVLLKEILEWNYGEAAALAKKLLAGALSSKEEESPAGSSVPSDQ